MSRKIVVVSIASLLAASVAFASWYDDYDAGIAAVRKGQWQTVVQKMTAAIGEKPQENDKLRAYGTLFYNYHPYYYRGVAYLNLGQYQKAVSDLEQATGIGEENLGSIDTLVQRAKSKLAAASAPEPQPVAPAPQPAAPQPQPTRPAVVAPQPAAPAISPAMRQQAAAAISEATQAMSRAQSRKASAAPAYNQALQQLADARQRQASAKSDDDLNAAIASAGNAKMFFDSATGPTAVATAPAVRPPTKVSAATNATIRPTANQVRSALEAYFRGDFGQAVTAFKQLSEDLPNNGWIYAFLGASQYSLYAFEADDSYKAQALESFKKAKQLHFRNGELPQKYFSKRIRKVFKEVAG